MAAQCRPRPRANHDRSLQARHGRHQTMLRPAQTRWKPYCRQLATTRQQHCPTPRACSASRPLPQPQHPTSSRVTNKKARDIISGLFIQLRLAETRFKSPANTLRSGLTSNALVAPTPCQLKSAQWRTRSSGICSSSSSSIICPAACIPALIMALATSM